MIYRRIGKSLRSVHACERPCCPGDVQAQIVDGARCIFIFSTHREVVSSILWGAIFWFWRVLVSSSVSSEFPVDPSKLMGYIEFWCSSQLQ